MVPALAEDAERDWKNEAAGGLLADCIGFKNLCFQ